MYNDTLSKYDKELLTNEVLNIMLESKKDIKDITIYDIKPRTNNIYVALYTYNYKEFSSTPSVFYFKADINEIRTKHNKIKINNCKSIW